MGDKEKKHNYCNTFKSSCVGCFHSSNPFCFVSIRTNKSIRIDSLDKSFRKTKPHLISTSQKKSWPWHCIGWRANTGNLIRPAAFLQQEVYIRKTWGLEDWYHTHTPVLTLEGKGHTVCFLIKLVQGHFSPGALWNRVCGLRSSLTCNTHTLLLPGNLFLVITFSLLPQGPVWPPLGIKARRLKHKVINRKLNIA